MSEMGHIALLSRNIFLRGGLVSATAGNKSTQESLMAFRLARTWARHPPRRSQGNGTDSKETGSPKGPVRATGPLFFWVAIQASVVISTIPAAGKARRRRVSFSKLSWIQTFRVGATFMGFCIARSSSSLFRTFRSPVVVSVRSSDPPGTNAGGGLHGTHSGMPLVCRRPPRMVARKTRSVRRLSLRLQNRHGSRAWPCRRAPWPVTVEL